MNKITTARTVSMLATIIVVALLVKLQSGGWAEDITWRADPGRTRQTLDPGSDVLPAPKKLSETGIRRLPPVSSAPDRVMTVSGQQNQVQGFAPRPSAGNRQVSRASWNSDVTESSLGLQAIGAAKETSAGAISLPRTADDGHVYENDLPSPKTSEPVSLHLNEVDVRQALEMLSLSHNINMLVGPTVTGSVTANLEGLDADTALNAILKLCNLVAHRENGLIYVYANAEYPQIDFQVRTFPLDYISGTDVIPVIQSLLSAAGQVFATAIDPLDNSKTREAITVIDMPRVIQRAAEFIRQVDVPPLQVMIEAHVLQVLLDDDCRHGINYNQAMQAIGSGAIELDVVGFADPAASPGVFARLHAADVDVLLEFLKETTDSKTLASPRVMAINGQTAKIQVGEQIPYKVITVTETLAIEEVRFLNVGVVLEVTPRISRDGHVLMRVKPKVSDGKFSPESNLPGEETREVESDVLIRDGEGLVIGGLIQEKDIDIQTKIPFWGDIHYIGRLFQKRARTKQRTEVVITLIPRIQYPEGYHERELINAERSQTRLFHKPLDPVYRPWSPPLQDAVNNPITFRGMYGGNCQNCGTVPCAEHSPAGVIGPEKPVQPGQRRQPIIPTESDSGESLVPPPVVSEPTGLAPTNGQDFLPPPPVHVQP